MPEPANPNHLGCQLLQSAKDGDLDQLKTQLARWEAEITGDSITQPEHLGFTPYHHVLQDIREMLGRKYSDPIELVFIMLNQLMIRASMSNRVNILNYLLDDREWPISNLAVRGAIFRKSFDALEVFLAHGWDINKPVEEYGGPILRLRLLIQRPDIVRWFLEHGADPNGCNAKGYMHVLSKAAEYAPVEVFQLLAAYGADFGNSSALHIAATRTAVGSDKEEPEKVLRWLLDQPGVHVNQRDPNGSGMPTALFGAADTNAVDCARLLVQRGIDINIKDQIGRTARDIAQEKGFVDILEILDTVEI